MSSPAERQSLLGLVDDACRDGARLAPACAQIGLSERTVQRWQQQSVQVGDRRVAGQRHPVCPHNKLSAEERQAALTLLNSDAYKDLPPSQIVPRLADQGQYLCSESTLFRLLHEVGQATHRGVAKAPHPRSKPRALLASTPDQIYCWDSTYLPRIVRGEYFYLYLFEDLFSRKIVGWQVFDCESAALAGQLLEDICLRQGIPPGQVTLQRLGVAASRSRPSVSNDNPYAESLFRTLKYRPQFPLKPFADLLAARHWVTAFVHWYNSEHRHSTIRFVTPEQWHRGDDPVLLANRATVYARARQANPARRSRHTRNRGFIDAVQLNPDRQQLKETEPTQAAA